MPGRKTFPHSLKLAPAEPGGNKSSERFSQFWTSKCSEMVLALTHLQYVNSSSIDPQRSLRYDSGRSPWAIEN